MSLNGNVIMALIKRNRALIKKMSIVQTGSKKEESNWGFRIIVKIRFILGITYGCSYM